MRWESSAQVGAKAELGLGKGAEAVEQRRTTGGAKDRQGRLKGEAKAKQRTRKGHTKESFETGSSSEETLNYKYIRGPLDLAHCSFVCPWRVLCVSFVLP
jgi:hypothetical protein